MCASDHTKIFALAWMHALYALNPAPYTQNTNTYTKIHRYMHRTSLCIWTYLRENHQNVRTYTYYTCIYVLQRSRHSYAYTQAHTLQEKHLERYKQKPHIDAKERGREGDLYSMNARWGRDGLHWGRFWRGRSPPWRHTRARSNRDLSKSTALFYLDLYIRWLPQEIRIRIRM